MKEKHIFTLSYNNETEEGGSRPSKRIFHNFNFNLI